MNITENAVTINEKEAMEKDVRTMSCEDLMAAIRFLDKERNMLAANVHEIAEKTSKRLKKQEKVSRVA